MVKMTEEQAQKIADKQDNTYGEPDKITNRPPVDWKTKRINAINRILSSKGNSRVFHEHFSDEHYRICESKATTKKEYKEENQ
tara:strand:+ start:473 stop:721 length:249 start_codon:yes stop_codon:yes gene_type:complete